MFVHCDTFSIIKERYSKMQQSLIIWSKIIEFSKLFWANVENIQNGKIT